MAVGGVAYGLLTRECRELMGGWVVPLHDAHLVVAPDLSRLTWKDKHRYAQVRRLGIVTDTEYQAVDATRAGSSR